MAHNGLDTELQFLPGAGPKRSALLKKELAVETVGQLLRLYPFRYIDRSSFTRICDIRPDMAYIQIKATVIRSEIFDKKRLSVWISDGSGELETVFFKGIKWMVEKLQPGSVFVFFGKPSAFNGRINLVHPEVDQPGSSSKENGLKESLMPAILSGSSPRQDTISRSAARVIAT